MADNPDEFVPKTEIHVKQLNLGYNPEQDRLLLKIGMSDDSEIVAWVTYRIAREIWVGLNAEANVPNSQPMKVNDHVPEQAVKVFKQQVKAAEILQTLDFATEYQPREVKHSLQQGPLLIVKVAIAEQNQQMVLNMTCVGAVNIALNLTSESILAICNMLQLSCREAGWHIGNATAVSSSMMMESKNKQILH